MNEIPNITCWVRVTTSHYCLLEGLDTLKEDLEKKSTTVQLTNKWRPAFCTGFECSIDIFSNFNISDAIIGGIAYDLGKEFLKRTWIILKQFIEKNRHEDFFPIIKFNLNDTTLIVPGNLSIEEQSRVLEDMSGYLGKLSSVGITNISNIEFISDTTQSPILIPDSWSEFIDFPMPNGWLIKYGADEFIHFDPRTGKLTNIQPTVRKRPNAY